MLNGKISSGSWRVVVVDHARKQLKKIPYDQARRITMAIDALRADPYGGDTKQLRGEENSWRRRVGAYRILYDVLSKERAVFVYPVRTPPTLSAV